MHDFSINIDFYILTLLFSFRIRSGEQKPRQQAVMVFAFHLRLLSINFSNIFFGK